jgi:hypothetical protein
MRGVTPTEARAGGSSKESQPVHTGGRHFVSYPARASKRYGLTTTSAYILKQALWGSEFRRAARYPAVGRGPDPSPISASRDITDGSTAGCCGRGSRWRGVLCGGARDRFLRCVVQKRSSDPIKPGT